MMEESMPSQTLDELRDVHRFLSAQLTGGKGEMSPEEALDEWRRLHPEAVALEEEVAAIREALDDLANGDRGTPFDEFDHEFRKRHNLNEKASWPNCRSAT
jgi:hypothetical protein